MGWKQYFLEEADDPAPDGLFDLDVCLSASGDTFPALMPGILGGHMPGKHQITHPEHIAELLLETDTQLIWSFITN